MKCFVHIVLFFCCGKLLGWIPILVSIAIESITIISISIQNLLVHFRQHVLHFLSKHMIMSLFLKIWWSHQLNASSCSMLEKSYYPTQTECDSLGQRVSPMKWSHLSIEKNIPAKLMTFYWQTCFWQHFSGAFDWESYQSFFIKKKI